MFEPDTLRPHLDLFATTEPRAVSDDDLTAAALALEAVRATLDATEARVLAELHTRGVTDRAHGLRTGPWLARDAHLPIPAAAARVRAAVVLVTWFPHVLTALRTGRISWDHAAVIARAANPRIAAQLAEHQQALLDAADRTVFARWRLEVIGLADQLDQDGGHDPTRDHARNRLSVNPTFDGLAHLSGLLTAELGPVVVHAIEVRAELLLQRHLADQKIDPTLPVPSRAELRAYALVEICRLAGATWEDDPDADDDADFDGDDADFDGDDADFDEDNDLDEDDNDEDDNDDDDDDFIEDNEVEDNEVEDNEVEDNGDGDQDNDNADRASTDRRRDHESTRDRDEVDEDEDEEGDRHDPSDDLWGFDDLTAPDHPNGRVGTNPPTPHPPSPRRTPTPDPHPGHPPGDHPVQPPRPADHARPATPPHPGGPTDPPRPPGPAEPPGRSSLSDRSRGRPERSRDRRRAAARVHPHKRRRRVRELPRPEVLLIIHSDHPDTVYTATGQPLPDGIHNPLFTDPDLYAAVIDSLGVPLDMGRKVRLATTAQRRAARIRDGGCVFPGCDEPPERCRMHHIDLWDHGGLTDLAVLAALCPHHHGVTHRNHWHMHATPDAWFWWQTPTGRTIWSQRHGRQHPAPPRPAHLHANTNRTRPPLDTRPHRAA